MGSGVKGSQKGWQAVVSGRMPRRRAGVATPITQEALARGIGCPGAQEAVRSAMRQGGAGDGVASWRGY